MANLPGKIAPDVINKFQQADPCKTKSQIFEEPIPLISTNEKGVLECNENAIKELCQIEKALNVVAVVGTLRTGKSYLLNKLANIESGSGFAMGHTTEPVTKGMWVKCCPHPEQEDQILVLLDTEGVCDPEKTDRAEDQWVFVLATLLCSTLVYNNRGPLDQTALDQLKFLKVIESSVKLCQGTDGDFLLDFYLPTFVLALRDFTLKLEETPDAYLERMLKLKEGQTSNIKVFNDEKKLIRRYFPRRKCFLFPIPVSQGLETLMDLADSKLDAKFLGTFNKFKEHVYSLKPKMLKSGRTINGRMLATLLKSFLRAIEHKECPCIMEALQNMTDDENEYVIKRAANLYREQMKNLLAKYMPKDDEGLTRYHQECMSVVMNMLETTTVYTDIDVCKQRIMDHFKQHLKECKKLIDQDSRDRCWQSLLYLNKVIEGKLRKEAYNVFSGYDDYWNDVNHIITQYNRKSHLLGLQAPTVLQKFIDGKEQEEQTVYEMVLQIQSKSAMVPKMQPRLSAKFELSNCHVMEENIISEDVAKNVQKMQSTSRQAIHCQYIDLEKLKLHELEKVKEELSPNDPYYQKLQAESRKLKEIDELYHESVPPTKDAKGVGTKFDCTIL